MTSQKVHDGHRARKRFGQNFLNDQSIIDSIIACVNAKPTDNLIEIGPGLGALTKPLLAATNRLTAIELDRDLIARLAADTSRDNLILMNEDALRVDFEELFQAQSEPGHLRIVGNLPYNISSPLLFHLLGFRHVIRDMHFMLQKEVVNRLVAGPGSKTYGRLSVMFQHYCLAEAVLDVPASAFTPAPKVESAVIRLTPRHKDEPDSVTFDQLQRIVQQSFSARRKTLRNNLRDHLSVEQLVAAGFDPSARAETLAIRDFITLAKLCDD